MAGAYIQVIPTPDTVALIRRITRGVALPLYPNSELHCTVMYSPAPDPASDFLMEKSEHLCEAGPFTAYADRADIWESQGGSKIVVLRLRSSDLVGRHEFWRQQGLRSTFPSYNPHVTLCDNVRDPEQLKRLTRTVEIINMLIGQFIGRTPLTFKREVMKETKPDKPRAAAQPKRPDLTVIAGKKGSGSATKKAKIAPMGVPGLHPPNLDETEERSMQENGFNVDSHKRLLDGLGKF